jgi:twitching motility protein PilT
MNVSDLLRQVVEVNASDLHITAGVPPMLRVNGVLSPVGEQRLTPVDTRRFASEVMSPAQQEAFEERGDLDFSYSLANLGRFRVNCYHQRGSVAISFRTVYYELPSMEYLGIPTVIKDLCRRQRGLIVVTGPTGSGKSTTLSTMIHAINEERRCHILTLEDPIEYLHKHNRSIINQREVGQDTPSFAAGLRAALREDPDVILVGEMRDLETISIALTAAETGHLVLSTLHTPGASRTVDRIVDVFPSFQQQQVRVQLAAITEAIIYQQLLPKADNSGRVPAFEILLGTPAVRNLIREGKNHQLDNAMQTGVRHGMQTMDGSLLALYRDGVITKESLLTNAMDVAAVARHFAVE